MKKGTSKIFKVTADVYPLVLLVIVNATNEESYKTLVKLNVAEDCARAMDLSDTEAGKANVFGRSLGVIRITRKLNSPEFHATLNHELFHIVMEFLKDMGVIYDSNSEEAYAYLISHLTKQIYEKL